MPDGTIKNVSNKTVLDLALESGNAVVIAKIESYLQSQGASRSDDEEEVGEIFHLETQAEYFL